MSGSGLGGLETIFQSIFTFSRPSFSRVFFLLCWPNTTTNLPLHAGSGGRVPPSRLNRQNITTNLPLHAGSGGTRAPPVGQSRET